ncbi:MAG: hypothetical protein NC133_00880 [Prevotella sp.]|nr:hypothetical protein [Prevotella sp.]
MDFAQLKSSLKSQIESAYLLYGTDYFLIHKAVSLIQAALPSAEMTKFADDVTGETITTALATTSFFTNARLVVATLGEKTALSAINQYLKNPVAGNVLVLISYREKPEANLKGATVVNCNPMPATILIPLIARQIAPHQITRDAATYLVEATGGYYTLIDNELTKFLAYYADVPVWDTKHLQPYLTKTLDYQIYELGAAILAHQVTAAANIFAWLLGSNTNEYLIFGGVVAQMRRAYYATASHEDINVLGKRLGCSPYAIKYSRRDYGANPSVVKDCYARSLELEYQIKAGQTTVTAALDALIYR